MVLQTRDTRRTRRNAADLNLEARMDFCGVPESSASPSPDSTLSSVLITSMSFSYLGRDGILRRRCFGSEEMIGLQELDSRYRVADNLGGV